MNAILPCSFSVRHLPELFCYLLNTYDHSFLTVFNIYQLVLNNFQPFCFSVMPFPNALKITPKFCGIFFCSKSKILFCLNCSILCWYLLTLALLQASFASAPQSQISMPFFSLYTFHLILSILRFFFNPSSSITSVSRKLTTSINFFISLSILRFHLGSFCFLCSGFLNSIRSANQTLAALIKLFASLMLSLLKYLITSLTLICLNLQNLFIHFLKHNAITCSSFHHYFFQLFNNRPMFFTQISLSITDTIFYIICSSSTVPTSVSTVSASTVTSCFLNVHLRIHLLLAFLLLPIQVLITNPSF